MGNESTSPTSLEQANTRWFKQKSIGFVDVQYLLGNMEAENTWQNLGYEPYRVMARKII